MGIVPVLDLLGGVAVHAVAGDRANYRAVDSRLGHGSDPVGLARRMVESVGATAIYVADLGAITRGRRHDEWILRLLGGEVARGLTLYWDAGLARTLERGRLPTRPDFVPIWGSETASPADLGIDPPIGKCAFSVDLADGVILGDWREWGVRDERDAPGLAAVGVRLTGANSVIVLDLRRVGVGRGPIDSDVIRALRDRLPAGVRLGVGGGVRHDGDLTTLDKAGVEFALVASAIHDDTLTPRRRTTTDG